MKGGEEEEGADRSRDWPSTLPASPSAQQPFLLTINPQAQPSPCHLAAHPAVVVVVAFLRLVMLLDTTIHSHAWSQQHVSPT